VTREPFSCDDAADANDSGLIDLADGVDILGWLFFGTSPRRANGKLYGHKPEESHVSKSPTGSYPQLGNGAGGRGPPKNRKLVMNAKSPLSSRPEPSTSHAS